MNQISKPLLWAFSIFSFACVVLLLSLVYLFSIDNRRVYSIPGEISSTEAAIPVNADSLKKVDQVLVSMGDTVKAGQALILGTDVSSKESRVYAPAAGVITEVRAQEGMLITSNEDGLMVGLKPSRSALTFAITEGVTSKVAVGNKVELLISGQNGISRITGTVIAHLSRPTGERNLFYRELVVIRADNEADAAKFLSPQILTVSVPATLQVKTQPIYRWIFQRLLASYD